MKPYEDLANAIIVVATHDYLNACRNYFKFIAKAEKCLKNPEVIVRKPNETYKCFNNRLNRHTAKTYQKRANEYKLLSTNLRDFFCGDWFSQLSDLDGKEILDQLDKKLKKEGHNIWD